MDHFLILKTTVNNCLSVFCKHRVVCDIAKIQNFTLFTTCLMHLAIRKPLFAILQRYKILRYSQQGRLPQRRCGCCLRYCKDTKFYAIHNHNTAALRSHKLFAILQRYKILRYSQQKALSDANWVSCLRYCKDTKFYAIHNPPQLPVIGLVVVCDIAKIQNFTLFTTVNYEKKLLARCLRYCKDTKFYAIHNADTALFTAGVVVCDIAKIQNFTLFTTRSALLYLED